MITDQLNKLQTWDIVLASASPRRLQIFRHNMGLKNVRVVASTFDESSLDKSSFAHPSLFVMENARQKGLQVQSTLASTKPADLLVSADTVVSFANKILEKPADAEHAKQMLRDLSGREHVVYTGVCFFIKGLSDPVTFFTETTVQFDDLSDELIEAYIQTGEPFDKAGGYGIQDLGGMFVKAIHGCYYNVMGFPLHMFCSELAKAMRATAQ